MEGLVGLGGKSEPGTWFPSPDLQLCLTMLEKFVNFYMLWPIYYISLYQKIDSIFTGTSPLELRFYESVCFRCKFAGYNISLDRFPPPPSASEEDDTVNECKSNWGKEMPYVKGKGRKLRLKKRRKAAECLPEAPPEHLPFCCDDCDPSKEKDTQKMDDPGCTPLLEGPSHPIQAFKDAIDKCGRAWGGIQDIFCHYPERSTQHQIDSLRGNANVKLSKEDEAPQSIESCYLDPVFHEQMPKEQMGEIKQSTQQKDSKERIRLGLSLEKVQPEGSKEKLDRPDSKEKVAPDQMKNNQVIKHGHPKSLECTMSDSEDIPFMRAEIRKYPKKKIARYTVKKGAIELEAGKRSKQGQASKSRESVAPGVRRIKSPEMLIARDFNNMKVMKGKPRSHKSQNGKFPRHRLHDTLSPITSMVVYYILEVVFM
ncbi:unnamed protein product [Heligmosomoides polygyrus]|uniref:Uncharacterized protein n=1 Tax=Heligmosomoides polygyrus TaxID=6339 RepID=A0A183FKP7_HELPZ|nr:unnamed protein product [Heligmosomoides polygyrus]